ncbi:MAG: PadR family transcriptional regulator [Solirubrobacterales bacterium]|nr:PadR family transcriptional regulator [Solirubrobacterales bacterium]
MIERPSHGYQLAQRFGDVYGDTLALSDRRNVYRMLRALHAEGLIQETAPSAKEKPAPNRQPKPHFRATAKGVRAYQQWLVSQMEEQRARQRLFALQLSMLDPGMALSVIERYEQECLQEAGEAAEAEQIAPSERGAAGVAHRLADADERLALEVRLTWIAYARSELQALLKERTGSRDE